MDSQQPNEQNKNPNESEFWKKYDMIFHRIHIGTSSAYYSVRIVGWIILVATVVLTFVVIPYWLVFLVLVPQSASMGFQFYNWYKRDNSLVPWYTQYFFVPSVVVCSIAATLSFLKGEPYLTFIAFLWVCSAIGWFALIVLTAYEQDKKLQKTVSDLLDIDRDIIGLGRSI